MLVVVVYFEVLGVRSLDALTLMTLLVYVFRPDAFQFRVYSTY